MKRKKVLAIFFLILGMVFPQTAFTEDFTLRVPVKISNLHDQVVAARISCLIFSSELGQANSTVYRSQYLDISSRNIDTIVELKLDPAVNVDPTRIDSYQCTMDVQKGGGMSPPFPSDDPFCINEWVTNAYRCGLPGTIFREITTGSIP